MSKPLGIELYFAELACIERTRERGLGKKRDEIYIRCWIRSPNGTILKRLPRDDDYYEFFEGDVARAVNWNDWTNRNQKSVGPPTLWTGVLRVGQKVDCMVLIMEQDNRELKKIKSTVVSALDESAKLASANKKAEAAIRGAKILAEFLPDSSSHEFVGAFSITIENRAEGASMIVVPLRDTKFEFGRNIVKANTTFEDSGNPFVDELLKKTGILGAASLLFRVPIRGYYTGVVAARPPIPVE